MIKLELRVYWWIRWNSWKNYLCARIQLSKRPKPKKNSRYVNNENFENSSKGLSLFYVDKILDFFDPLPPFVDILFSKIGIFWPPSPLGCLGRIRTSPKSPFLSYMQWLQNLIVYMLKFIVYCVLNFFFDRTIKSKFLQVLNHLFLQHCKKFPPYRHHEWNNK